MNNSSSIQIPDSVEKAVAALLAPYGLNARKLIAKADEERTTLPKLEVKYLTPTQVKHLYNISRWTVWRAAKDGKLRTVKPAGRSSRQSRVLVDKASLESWIEGREQNAN